MHPTQVNRAIPTSRVNLKCILLLEVMCSSYRPERARNVDSTVKLKVWESREDLSSSLWKKERERIENKQKMKMSRRIRG